MRRLHWPKFKAPRNCRKQSFMNVCSSGNGTAGVRTFACACACGSRYLLLRGGYYLQAAADIENDWVGSCSNLKTSPFRVWRFCGAREKFQRRFKGSRTFPETTYFKNSLFVPGWEPVTLQWPAKVFQLYLRQRKILHLNGSSHSVSGWSKVRTRGLQKRRRLLTNGSIMACFI